MQQRHLQYRRSIIHYHVFGNGPKPLFCFHGYGEDGSSFAFLEPQLGTTFTLYAPDFPVHGQTRWNEREPFTPQHLEAVLRAIHPAKEKFSLLAYSMGGRAALHLLQQIPGSIEQVALVAPDGLRQNPWYWLTTQTGFGNKAFAYTMRKPAWFFTLVTAGAKMNLLNRSLVKFVHHHLDDMEQRTLLYKRWTSMRRLKPNLLLIKKLCATRNIRLNMLFGAYDRIILSRRANVFLHTANISIKVINAGHQLMKEKYATEIVALLNER